MFYKVTAEGETLAVKLSLKNPNKKFFPKWWVKGMDSKSYVAIHCLIPSQTIGLFLGYGQIYRGDYPKGLSNSSFLECVILLVGDQRFYIPVDFVTELSKSEFEEGWRSPGPGSGEVRNDP